MSKIKLTGESSGYVEISAGNAAGNNTLEAPTSGTRLVAHEGSQDVTLNGNLTVNGVVSYEDVTNIDSVGVVTARDGLHVTGGLLGVGTNNPDRMLSVSDQSNGNLARFIGPTNNLFIMNDRSGIIDLNSSGTGDHLCLGTENTERLRITSDGLVGIGTVTPTTALEIRTTTTNAATHYRNNASNGGAYFGVRATDLGAASAGEAYIYSYNSCLLYTSPSPRDVEESRMPSSA